MRRFRLAPLVAAISMTLSASALAQDDGSWDEGPRGADPLGGEAPAGEPVADDGAEAYLSGSEQPEIEAPVEDTSDDLAEPNDTRLWMVGARWRTIFVPNWLMNAFMDFPEWGDQTDSGPFFVNQAAGVEFTTRMNNLSIVGALWWAGYWSSQVGRAYKPAEFLATEEGDPTDPEFTESNLSLFLITADFIFSTMFYDWFGITYGAGLGLGITIGEVTRDEAYPTGPGEYEHCNGPGSPDGTYCELRGGDDDGYYDAPEDRVWPVFPWVNFLLGLRFKPMRHLEINVDGGVGLGFLLGMRVNYIF